MVELCQPAVPADVDVILALMREYYAFDRLPLDEPAARRALQQLLGDPALGRAWLIWANGEAVGYVVLTLGFSLELQGRDAFIDEIFLRERWRGRGLGQRVLAFVEDVCRTLDVRALHLEVTRDNAAAQQLYRRVGFADRNHYLMTKRVAS